MKRRKVYREPSAPSTAVHADAYLAVAIALAALVVALHALGTFFVPGQMWGAHTYAFLPPAAIAFGAAASLAVAFFGLHRVTRERPALVTRTGRSGSRVPRVLRWTTIPAASFAILWTFRSRQLLLGDGLPLTANLPYETTLHVREPLTSLLHQNAYRVAQALGDGRDVHLVARDAVAAGSVLAGVLFVLVAFALGGAVMRLRPEPDRLLPATGAGRLAGGVLLAQGFVVLFFGYVENYTYLALGIAVYLFASLAALRGVVPLIVPGAALVLCTLLHLSAVTLLPSWLVLAAVHVWSRETRGGALRDTVLLVMLAAAAAAALFAWGGGYRIDEQLRTMAGRNAIDLGYMLSRVHVRDFFNEQVLIGPFALLWCIPVAALAIARGALRSVAAVFLLVAAGSQALAAWIVPDLPLGYARDWDLFAPGAIVFTVAALGLLALGLGEPRALSKVLVVALAASIFHTAPWITLNASELRSVERFKALPLGGGRTESTVGFWYFANGRYDEAKTWLARAVAADPRNVRGYVHLGNVYLSESKYDSAAAAFAQAVALRPNQPGFREQLVYALAGLGRTAEAAAHSEVLLQQEPDVARHWAVHGVLLTGLDREVEAREALGRAVSLDPASDAYRRAFERLGTPEAYTTMVSEDWPRFLAP